jgi:hypothetical protein
MTMTDYTLKDQEVTFRLLNRMGDECHCTFKVDLEVSPLAFSDFLFPAAVVELVEAGSGKVATAEMIAVDVGGGSYSTNMFGWCVFRLLSGYTQFGIVGSSV